MTAIDLHIAPRNTDVEAFRARMEAKRARNHYFEQLETRAVEAATRRPVKVAAVKKARTATTTTPPKPKSTGVRPCVQCGHPTRTAGILLAAAPGTKTRVRNGLCSTCASPTGIPRKPRTTPEEVAAWIVQYQAGQTAKAIAEAAGRHEGTVVDNLKRAGITVTRANQYRARGGAA